MPTPPAENRVAAALEVLDVRKLGLDELHRGSPFDQQFHVDVVADRHLVEEPTELGLQQREAFGETFALGVQFSLLVGGRLFALLGVPPHQTWPHGTDIWLGSACCERT
jgi:hypothetical protein